MDRIQREQAVHLAAEADHFLQNPLYQQSLSDERDRIFLAWVQTQPGQRDEREELWQQFRALVVAEQGLRNQIDDGTIAKAEQKTAAFRATLG